MSADRKRVKRDDDKFFQRQDRQYRVRRASAVEISEKRLNGGLPPLPQDWRWYLVIRDVAPGRRIALFVPNLEDATTDVDEGVAHCLFDYAAASCPYDRNVASASRMAADMKDTLEDHDATRH